MEDVVVVVIVQLFQEGKHSGPVVRVALESSVKDLIYADHLFGARNRKQTQRGAVQHREDSHIDSNAQSNRQHGGRCKSWVLPQHPQAITQILEKVLNEIHAASVAAFLFGLLDTAQVDSRASVRFV